MDGHRPRLRTSVALVSLVALGAVAAIAVAACAFEGTNETGAQSVCTPMAAYLETCSANPACPSAVNSQCSEMSASLSDSLINDVIACQQLGQGCDAGTVLESPCVLLSGVVPSAAQTQVATDFCAVCAPTGSPSSCAQSFYAPGGVGVASAPVFAAADSIALTIDRSCALPLPRDAGSAACTAAFVDCARPILHAQLVIPTSCATSAGVIGPLPGDSE